MSLLDGPVEIAIVDYGMGNRRSVEKAFQHIGASVTITSDHRRLRTAAGLVVPGVGAFPRGMANLRELGLDELLRERLAHGTPVLGVCLGMQLGFERSSEQGGTQGLGVIGGEVRQLEHGSLKLPHIGWNEVSLTASSPAHRGVALALRLLPRALVRARPHFERGHSRHRLLRRAIREHRRPRRLLRRAVSPREVLGGRVAAAGQFRAHLRWSIRGSTSGAGRLVRLARSHIVSPAPHAMRVRT